MSIDKVSLELLNITADIHRNAQKGVVCAGVAQALCKHLKCDDVSDIARNAIERGLEPEEVLREVTCSINICAAPNSGRCTSANAELKQHICFSVADHLNLSLATVISPRLPRSQPSPAATALDTIECPLVVCDNELRLKHANRTGEIELESGRWLCLLDGRVALKGASYTATLEKLVTSLNTQNAPDRLHFPLFQSEGRSAELWLRRLLRGGDHPGLILVSIVPEPENPMQLNGNGNLQQKISVKSNLPLTEKQLELARLLLGGHNLTKAAHHMGISRATANGHLKHLFEFSRTRRQVDLVGWLSRNLGV
jgi:DNA-binding CsgD family transcriptional regulator